MHEYRWGTDDFYIACLLRPLNTDITICPAEIADAKWMDVRRDFGLMITAVHTPPPPPPPPPPSSQVDAYLADPNTFSTNKLIGQSYKDGLARGLFIRPTVFPHFLTHKPDMVMYSPQPVDSVEPVSSAPTTQRPQKANM